MLKKDVRKSNIVKKPLPFIVGIIVVGFSVGILFAATKTQSVFAPKYDAARDSSLGAMVNQEAFDSSQTGNDGLTADENTDNSKDLNTGDDQLIQDQSGGGLVISDGTGTGTGTGTGLGTNSNGSGPSIVVPGGGTDGNDGSNGGGGETDPDYNPDPDRITISGSPDTSLLNPNREKILKFGELHVEQTITPSVYRGQKILISDILDCINTNKINSYATLKDADNKVDNENIYSIESCISRNYIGFGTTKDFESNTVIKDDAALGSGYESIVFYKPGVAGDPMTAHFNYVVYNSKVIVNGVSSDEPLVTDAYTNDDTFNLDASYKKMVSELQQDSEYLNSDETLNKLFLGWWTTDKDNPSTKSCKVETGVNVLKVSDLADVPEGYIVKIIEGEQTLVGFNGQGNTITVPNGVTRIELDDNLTKDGVSIIELSSSVDDIDFNSINTACPKLSEYSTSEIGNSKYFVADGVLYSKNEDGELKLIHVPPKFNWTNGLTLPNSENGKVTNIGNSAFSAFDNSPTDIVLNVSISANEVKGLKNIPDKASVNVATSTGHIAYLQYLCVFSQGAQNIKLTENHVDIKGNYAYEDNCIYEGDKLVYISPKAGTKFSTPQKAKVIGNTAFVDMKDITSLTINNTVTSMEKDCLDGLDNLITIDVKNPAGVTIENQIMGASHNNELKIYLEKTEESSDSFIRWKAAVSDSENHLVAMPGGIYINPVDGATYQVEGEEYTLISVPAGVKIFTEPEDKTVVGVFDGAFDSCDSIEVVYVSNDSLKKACNNQVKDFPNLKLVATTDDAIIDDDYVFYNKDKSELLAVVTEFEGTLTLDEKTISIAQNAAKNCDKLENVIVPSEKLDTIGSSAFENCASLKFMPKAPNDRDITEYNELGNSAFKNCSSLEEVALCGIGDNATIGNECFSGASGIKTVTFKGAFDTTGSSTFVGCDNLQTVNFEGKLSVIGAHAFDGCKSLMHMYSTNGQFNQSIKEIQEYAFNNCPNMYIDFGFLYTKLEIIGNYAFYNDVNLEGLYFPASIKTIGDYAFGHDSDLSEETHKVSYVKFTKDCALTYIGDYAFLNRSNILLVNFDPIISQEGVTIGNYAFQGCESLNTCYWGEDTIKSIGNYCFAGCKLITDAELQKQTKLDYIGEGAFAGCSSIESADFSQTALTEIPANLFGFYGPSDDVKNCENLSEVLLGSQIRKINDGAFSGATGLKNITIYYDSNMEVVEIGENVFYKGTSDESSSDVLEGLSILVPPSVDKELYNKYIENPNWRAALTVDDICYSDDICTTSFDGSELYYCGGIYEQKDDGTYILKSMNKGKTNAPKLYSKTSEIADEAFKDCANITGILIPEATEKIGKNAFQGCVSMEFIAFENKKGTKVDTSLFGETKVNDNFRIYILSGTAATYGEMSSLKEYGKMICTGERYYMEPSTASLYSLYSTVDSEGNADFLYQLMYLPRSYSKAFGTIPHTSYIYDEALRGSNITSFQTANSELAYVGDYAFADCENLITVNLKANTNGSKLDHIGDYAFSNCKQLSRFGNTEATAVVDSVSTMGIGVFKGDYALTKATWGSRNLSDVPESTFEDCINLTQMSFSPTLTDINKPVKSFGKRCFAGCTAYTQTLGSLTAFSGLESIGEECYDGCDGMTLIAIPSTVNSIGNNAFRGCDKLSVLAMCSSTPVGIKAVGISNSVWENLDVYVPNVNGCKQEYIDKWMNEGLTMPKSITNTGRMYRAMSGNIYGCDDPTWLFYGKNGHNGLIYVGSDNKNLASGTIKAYASSNYRVTEIGANALAGNTDIVTFTGYPYIEKIGYKAFENCKNLTKVELYASYNYAPLYIEDYAFSGCSNLSGLALRKETLKIGSYAFSDMKEGFYIDARKLTTSNDIDNCVLGEKIFGDELTDGAWICFANDDIGKYALKVWGAQLQEEYNLTEKELYELFNLEYEEPQQVQLPETQSQQKEE